MLLPFVGRDIREQYAGSLLGITWSLLQPLLLVLLYWWVFSAVLKVRAPTAAASDAPFIVFLLSALLPWFAFQDGLSRGAAAVVAHRDVVKKVYFPLNIFPLAAVTASFVNHGAGFVLFLIAWFVWQGAVAPGQVLAIGVLFALQMAMTVGFALLFAAFTVYLRDTSQVINILLPALFYTAPILYPLALVPEQLRTLVHLNPFTVYAQGYQTAVLEGAWLSASALVGLLLFAVTAMVLGHYVFRRLEPGFADVL